MTPPLGRLGVALTGSSRGGQGTEENSLLGDEGLGHEEAGGDGGATGTSENKASGEVKPDNPGPGDSQTRPCGLGRGGGEAAQHQAGEGHSDQAHKFHFKLLVVVVSLRG